MRRVQKSGYIIANVDDAKKILPAAVQAADEGNFEAVNRFINRCTINDISEEMIELGYSFETLFQRAYDNSRNQISIRVEMRQKGSRPDLNLKFIPEEPVTL